MPGGSGIDPYYQRDPPRRESRERRTEQDSCQVREVSRPPMTRRAKAEDVRQLYFEQGLSQVQVAKKLGVSLNTVQRVFRDNGWSVRRRQCTDEDVWHFYYQKGLTQEQVAQKLGIASRTVIDIFKKHGWKPRPLRKADEEEGRRLREQGLTQKQIAEKLGVSQSAVQQLLRKQGLGFSRKRVEIDSKELRQLYHEKRLTQKQIAEKLGVSKSAVQKIIREQGLEVPRRRVVIDADDLRRFCFEQGLPQKQIAAKLGVSESVVRKRVKEQGLTSARERVRISADGPRRHYVREGVTHEEIARRLGVARATVGRHVRERVENGGRRRYETDGEREEARKENAKRFYQNVSELRDTLFGRECRVCGVSKDRRNLAVHRKDGTEHEEDSLRRISFLKSVNPDEWAAVCRPCHQGVHWAKGHLDMDWDSVEFRVQERITHDQESRGVFSLPASGAMLNPERDASIEGTAEEMRKTMFGNKCSFCGEIPEDRKTMIHRKDGQEHSDMILRSKKYLRQLDPDDWVALCEKHHRYVHWAMRYLHLEWKDIDSAFRNNLE